VTGRGALLAGVVSLLAVGLAPLAGAQLKRPASPVGKWTFKTDELTDTCTISGDMDIIEESSGPTRRLTCNFRAVQACATGSIKSIHTEQSCTVKQDGAKISILSKVERIVSTDPAELIRGMDRRYAPDNFHLTINDRGTAMDGMFQSHTQAPVEFTRKGRPVS
jgi:hypothetical protein